MNFKEVKNITMEPLSGMKSSTDRSLSDLTSSMGNKIKNLSDILRTDIPNDRRSCLNNKLLSISEIAWDGIKELSEFLTIGKAKEVYHKSLNHFKEQSSKLGASLKNIYSNVTNFRLDNPKVAINLIAYLLSLQTAYALGPSVKPNIEDLKQERRIVKYIPDSDVEWARKVNSYAESFFGPINEELNKQGIGRIDPQYSKIKIKDWKSLEDFLGDNGFGGYIFFTGDTNITDKYGPLFAALNWIHESTHEDFARNPKRTEIIFPNIDFKVKEIEEQIVAVPLNGSLYDIFLIRKNNQNNEESNGEPAYIIYSRDGKFITQLNSGENGSNNNLRGIAQMGGMIGEFDFNVLSKDLAFKPSPSILYLYSEVMAPIVCEIATGNLQSLISFEELKRGNPALEETINEYFGNSRNYTCLDLVMSNTKYDSLTQEMRLQAKDIYQHIGYNFIPLVEETLKNNNIAFEHMLKEVSGITFAYIPSKKFGYVQALETSGKSKEVELRLALMTALGHNSLNNLIKLYCEEGSEAFISATEHDLRSLKTDGKISYNGKVLDEIELAMRYLQNSFIVGPNKISEGQAKDILNKIGSNKFEEVVKNKTKLKYIEELKHKYWLTTHSITQDDLRHLDSILLLYNLTYSKM